MWAEGSFGSSTRTDDGCDHALACWPARWGLASALWVFLLVVFVVFGFGMVVQVVVCLVFLLDRLVNDSRAGGEGELSSSEAAFSAFAAAAHVNKGIVEGWFWVYE